jgi:hypothetical protein
VTVPANQEWTETAVALTAGEKVSIAAAGEIDVNNGSLVQPIGRKFFQGPAGAGTCGNEQYAHTFPAPGVNCYGMLFKIGATGVPFPVGKKIAFRSPVSGVLYLGVNDDQVGDNSGSWSATIITP